MTQKKQVLCDLQVLFSDIQLSNSRASQSTRCWISRHTFISSSAINTFNLLPPCLFPHILTLILLKFYYKLSSFFCIPMNFLCIIIKLSDILSFFRINIYCLLLQNSKNILWIDNESVLFCHSLSSYIFLINHKEFITTLTNNLIRILWNYFITK